MALVPGAAATAPRFAFAYLNPTYTDKELHLEVVKEVTTIAVSRKRARDDDTASKDNLHSKRQEICGGREETIEEQRKDSEKTVDGANVLSRESTEKPVSGGDVKTLQEEGNTEHDAGRTEVLKVKTISVSAAIVASESPFFLKLFGNGMKETDQKVVSIRVTETEAKAVEDLILYIHKEKFNRTEPKDLVEILVAADKFQVNKAAIFCAKMMLQTEMTVECAILYLECSVALEAMKSVKVVARNFLVNNFKEVHRHQNTLLKMPLSVIKAIFSSSDLVVNHEDYIFNFLFKWATVHYSDLDERRGIFCSVLMGLIRFSHMTVNGLQQIGGCPLITNNKDLGLLATSAMLHKFNSSHRPMINWNYGQRVYLLRPIKVITFDPYPEVHAYMDLSLEDCSQMTKSGNSNFIDTQTFTFAGFSLSIRADTSFDPTNSPVSIGLYLCVYEFSRSTVDAQISFAVRQKTDGDFVTKVKINSSFASGSKLGNDNSFGCSWAQLTGEGSPYLINGRIHVRVGVRIKQL